MVLRSANFAAVAFKWLLFEEFFETLDLEDLVEKAFEPFRLSFFLCNLRKLSNLLTDVERDDFRLKTSRI